MVPLAVSLTDGGATQHAGEDYTLTCTVSGGETTATTTYHWLRDNSLLSGETSASLSFTPLRQTTPSSNGQYVCEAMRSGRTLRSEEFTIAVTGMSKLNVVTLNFYAKHVCMDTVPPLTLVITPSGSATIGQTYSLTCGFMGDESLDVPDVDNRFRWDRLTPTFQSAVIRAPTLSFTPLTSANVGEQYECINNIVSPYLTSSITHAATFTISFPGTYYTFHDVRVCFTYRQCKRR